MKRLCSVAIATVMACGAGTAPARAEIVVRAPFVSVRTGRGETVVCVQVPCIGEIHLRKLSVPAAIEVPAVPVPPPPPPQELLPPAQPVQVAPPPPAVVVPPRPPTLAEFAATFQPAPGTYEVVLTHPVTGNPTKVCFTLPAGSLKKIRVHRRELEFDYGRHFVSLRFDRHGVRVHSR
jgi:hypothetical protein